jgi:hypothetical protein
LPISSPHTGLFADEPEGAKPFDGAAEANAGRKNGAQGKEKKQKNAKRKEIGRSKNVDTFIHHPGMGAKPLN